MRTRVFWRSGNFTYRDEDFSAARGSSLWETALQLTGLDPGVVFTFLEDFFKYVEQSGAIEDGWIATKVGTGTIVISDASGGVLLITNSAGIADEVQIQWHAELFKLATNKPCWFEVRLKVSDATQSELTVGLCITDTTLIAGMTDGVYFRKNDGVVDLLAITEKDSVETSTDTLVDLVNDTFVRLGFFFDGAASPKVFFYVNGVLKATHTANIVNDEEITASVAFRNGEAVAKNISVDYIKAVQVR